MLVLIVMVRAFLSVRIYILEKLVHCLVAVCTVCIRVSLFFSYLNEAVVISEFGSTVLCGLAGEQG